MKHNIPATRDELLRIFTQIDKQLCSEKRTMQITVLGGASIILLGLRDRATLDIDIANVDDAAEFQKLCRKKSIPVDIITVSSTVDFDYAETVTVFNGKALVVSSVTPMDLIRLKLERFRKQDADDIEAIIAKTSLPYENFKQIVEDMLLYYIGNPREVLLSALIIAERLYPKDASDFKTLLS
ncbi:MAG: DUF6036 family nucleotidyltransferase [Pseudomonadota bacterium]